MQDIKLRLHAFSNSLANSISSPFVAFNVTASGGSDVLIGYVSTITTLASAISQLAGGRIVDKLGKRLVTTMVFSGVTGILWVASALLPNTTALAISYTAIAIAIGFYSAGWTSFLGEASQDAGRGTFLSRFARLTSLGSLAALLLTTAVTAFNPSYSILYLLSGASFVLSAVVLRGQREPPVEKHSVTLERTANIRKYYAATAFYGLFWGFAWPLFSITTVRIVHMSLVEYSFSQVIAVASTIALQPFVGRLVDRNRVRSVFLGRLGLVAYPVTYMFFNAAWQIYAISIFSGLTNALLNVAFTAYLYDISPAGHRGRYSAEFNLVTGVTTMIGSLVAGFALEELNLQYSLWLSLAYLYVIAAVGRTAAAVVHLKLSHGNLNHE